MATGKMKMVCPLPGRMTVESHYKSMENAFKAGWEAGLRVHGSDLGTMDLPEYSADVLDGDFWQFDPRSADGRKDLKKPKSSGSGGSGDPTSKSRGGPDVKYASMQPDPSRCDRRYWNGGLVSDCGEHGGAQCLNEPIEGGDFCVKCQGRFDDWEAGKVDWHGRFSELLADCPVKRNGKAHPWKIPKVDLDSDSDSDSGSDSDSDSDDEAEKLRAKIKAAKAKKEAKKKAKKEAKKAKKAKKEAKEAKKAKKMEKLGGEVAKEVIDEVINAVHEKPAQEKPAQEKPVQAKVAQEKPAQEKPVQAKVAQEKPVQAKVAQEKPVQAKVAQEKPAPPEPDQAAEDTMEMDTDTIEIIEFEGTQYLRDKDSDTIYNKGHEAVGDWTDGRIVFYPQADSDESDAESSDEESSDSE